MATGWILINIDSNYEDGQQHSAPVPYYGLSLLLSRSYIPTAFSFWVCPLYCKDSWGVCSWTYRSLFQAVAVLSVRSEAPLGKLEPGSAVILTPWRSQSSKGSVFCSVSISDPLATVHWEGEPEHEILGGCVSAHRHPRSRHRPCVTKKNN